MLAELKRPVQLEAPDDPKKCYLVPAGQTVEVHLAEYDDQAWLIVEFGEFIYGLPVTVWEALQTAMHVSLHRS